MPPRQLRSPSRSPPPPTPSASDSSIIEAEVVDRPSDADFAWCVASLCQYGLHVQAKKHGVVCTDVKR